MRRILFAWLGMVILPLGMAQAQSTYKLPPPEVVKILDAPRTPLVVVSPPGDTILLVDIEGYPPIRQLARPILRLAGVRIDPQLGALQRLVRFTGIEMVPLDGRPRKRIELPQGSRIGSPKWAPDGHAFAFTRELPDGLELWVADLKGETRAIPGVRVIDIMSRAVPNIRGAVSGGFEWINERQLLVHQVPAGRGPAPAAPDAPTGPNIEETSGKVAQVWTYQDLLKSSRDEDLFRYYATNQLARIDAFTGAVTTVGQPGLIASAEPSPDGKFLLVESLKPPFSYRVPYYLFPRSIDVLDANGGRVRMIADLPVSDDTPRQGVPTGPRDVEWQPLVDATLVWPEALDGGDPVRKAEHRDKLMGLAAPFQSEPMEILKVKHRYIGVSWTAQPGQALLTEFDRARRWRTTSLIDVGNPSVHKVAFDLSINDAYGNPGTPITQVQPNATQTFLQDGDDIYLLGQGASDSGDRPFLDKMNLKTLKKDRLFLCPERVYERPLSFVGTSRTKILTEQESKTEPTNVFVVDLTSGQRTKLTDFKDPAPQLTGLTKELIKYKRPDGVPLSGTLYLPPRYKVGTKLPLIIWAYPLEYSDAATAGQVRGSPYTFTALLGDDPRFFLTQGYAVLMNATMPVVGSPETMNDTYVEQITASAKAAIDALDAKGVIDRNRVGVAGHSYGAFMTANLLAHSDLFAAGIARSGAYNRTLTPFGFQSERRTFWEAPDLYMKMSPFTYANKIKAPLLLIHGEADNNSGTFPIQSERLFQAIKGSGGIARLVLLPYESHGYRARESVLDVLAEMFEWADKYIKNRTQPAHADNPRGKPVAGSVLPLRVLYVGNAGSPRAREYEVFLKNHFRQVEAVARKGFDPVQAKAFDVVILDWSQQDEALAKAKSPLGNETQWDRPTVLLGSAGLLMAGCWQLIGGAG
jgi:dipeptidyl aminopeptidase/acylaminoacyl peptidase